MRVVAGGWRAAQNRANWHARYLDPAGQTGRIWILCGFKVPARASAVGITVACQDVSAASARDGLQQRGRAACLPRVMDKQQENLRDLLERVDGEAREMVEQGNTGRAVQHMLYSHGVALEQVISRLRDVADMTYASHAKLAHEIRWLTNTVTIGGTLIILLLLAARWP